MPSAEAREVYSPGPGIALHHRVGAKPEPLHDARPVSFDDDVDLLDDLEASVAPLIGTDVDRQRAEPGIDDRIRVPIAARPVDAMSDRRVGT